VRVGDEVIATKVITEGGIGYPPNPYATGLGDPGWVHARHGDAGVVVHVNENGEPTVRFHKTGTATIVCADEVNYAH
jgi:hypothetical protein